MKTYLKKALAVILCIVMTLTGVPLTGMDFLIPKASAAAISENDLFMIFPEYLENSDTDKIERNCKSACSSAFSSCSDKDAALAVIATTLSEGIELTFKQIGSWVGWSDDYSTSCLKDSTMTFLLALTENDETLKSAVKSAEDIYKPLKKAYKASTETIRTTTKETFINKWVDSYMSTTGLSKTQSQKILGADWDLAHKSSTLKYIKKVTTVVDEVTAACDAAVAAMELSAIDLMLINTLMQYVDKNSELYKGLSLVKEDRVKSPEQYLVKTYFSEKGIKAIAKVTVKLLGEAAGLVNTICETIGYVLKKTILSGKTATDYVEGTTLMTFAGAMDDAVDKLKTKFIEGTASADQIQDFKILFSAYIAALKATCDAAYKFSRGKYRDAVDEYAAIIGDTYHYEAYIKSCTNNVSADITAGKISASGVYSAVSTALNESSIKERLAKIKAKYPVGSKYTGSFGYSAGNSQAFAQQVFYMLYDRKISPMVGGYWHTLSKNTNVKKIGTLTGSEVTTSAVTNLLSKAKVGDLITAHNNYGVHMMTVTGVGSSGVTVYDCDSRYNGSYTQHLVQEYVFSFSSLATTFSRSRYYDNYKLEVPGGISLYRAHVQKRVSTGSGRAIDYYTYDDSVNYIVTDGVLTGYKGSRSVLDIPDTVITIGASCFKNNKTITEVNMPDTVTTIESSAFNGCSNLRYVHFSGNLTTIKSDAFNNCSSLLSVVLPDSVTYIGTWCFGHCYDLSYVKLSKSLETLSGVAFGYCNSLKSIEIPKSISSTNGETGPFTGCEKLSEITFEEGITEIHAYLFKDCPGITEITIPETVTTIGACAFYQCHNLLSVDLPSNLTKIGGRAFYLCDALLSVEMPDSVVSIGDWCFGGCSSLSFVKLSKNISVLYGCAFGDCYSIQSIEIPKSITTTNGTNGSFIRCKNLREIIFEEGITEIPAYLFQDCTGIVNITIPETVTKIGACAFKNCSNLVSIKLPNGLETVGNSSFSGCTSLKAAEIKNDGTVLGERVFEGCESLETVKLPADMKTIPYGLFKDCLSLRTFNMPQKITKIEGQAFYNNDEMVAVTIPQSVTQIENGVFYDCDKLKTVTMSDSVTSLGTSSSSYGCFQGCEVLENVMLSKGLTIIRQNTFADCPALKEIEIPHHLLGGVTTIEKNAFKNCVSLVKATIPVTVSSIGAEAFSYPDKTVIYGCRGSYAETFANNGMNGKKFQFVDITKHITGMALKDHDDDKLTITKGTYVVPGFDYLPADTTDIVTLSTNTTTVARIQNTNQIYGYANGTTTATATTSGGLVYDFTVYVHSLNSLSVTSLPAKTVYNYGEELNLTGLSVTATYNDGMTETVSDYEVTGYSSTTYGEQTITVKYAGKSETFKVTVLDNRVKVDSIAVTTLPKTAYEKGEAFDETGMIVTATYTDGTTASVSGYSISAMNSLKVGTQTLTVTYTDPVSEQTFTTNFDVTVGITAPTLTSITVVTKPTKTTYTVGETLNTSGLVLRATYSDGSSTNVTGYTCFPTTLSTEGVQTITVTYQGKTATFAVQVNPKLKTLLSIAVTTKPSKMNYYVGETLNTSGMVVRATYSDGSTANLTDYTCSPTMLNTIGTQTITVTYEDKTTTFAVTVIPVPITLVKIDIKTTPTKTIYTVGESFDQSGLTLTATYSDGSTKMITSGFTCTGFSSATVGTKTVNVTYQGKTTTFTVEIQWSDVMLNKVYWVYAVGSTGKTLFPYYQAGGGTIPSEFYYEETVGNVTSYKYRTEPQEARQSCTICVTSSNPRVLRVDESTHRLIPVGNGEAELTITAIMPPSSDHPDGISKSDTITVVIKDSPYTPITDIKIGYDPKETDADASYDSDSNTITLSQSHKVKLVAQLNDGAVLNHEPIDISLSDGRTLRTVSPCEWSWKSSNEHIATVDANGRVTMTGSGTATITLTVNDNGVSFKKTVQVRSANSDPTITIHNYTPSRTVDYRTTITFSADPVQNPVADASVHWFINGQDKGASDTYTEKEAKATYTVQAKYMKGNTVLAETEIETVNVKTGFFARLKAFFRALFGRLPKVVQEYLGIEIIEKV